MVNPSAMKNGKKSRSFSVTEGEITEFDALGRTFGYERSEFLLALMEAAKAIPLALIIENGRPVLRPGLAAQLKIAAEAARRASEEKGKKRKPEDPAK